MKAMAPFGGGMGSSGQVCGTLSGALAVIGFTLGKSEARGRDHRLMWKLSYKMVKQFGKICTPYGGTHCTNITRLNWMDPDAVKEFYTNPESSRKNCVQVIRATSSYLHNLITKHFPNNEEE